MTTPGDQTISDADIPAHAFEDNRLKTSFLLLEQIHPLLLAIEATRGSRGPAEHRAAMNVCMQIQANQKPWLRRNNDPL